jgi:hypothetical protein
MQVYGGDETLLTALREAQVAADEKPTLRVSQPPESQEILTSEVLATPEVLPTQPVARIDEPKAAPSESVVEPIFEYVTTAATVEESPSPHARFIKTSDPVEPEDLILVAKRGSPDADMIVVEDDLAYAGAPKAEGILVRKQDYRQMFARLRRGNT